MPIWNVATVSNQPSVSLRDWQVFETCDNHQTRHFVGYCNENHEGRVSTEIIKFDPVTKRGQTKSGRTYQLLGSPGFDPDAMYVLEHWKISNVPIGGGVKFVSDQII